MVLFLLHNFAFSLIYIFLGSNRPKKRYFVSQFLMIRCVPHYSLPLTYTLFKSVLTAAWLASANLFDPVMIYSIFVIQNSFITHHLCFADIFGEKSIISSAIPLMMAGRTFWPILLIIFPAHCCRDWDFHETL